MTKYYYKPGTVRWLRHTRGDDVRLHRAPKGWSAFADLLDEHPITGKQLKRAQWWIRETFEGD